jgi:predicted RNA-binding protein with PUA-like domain
MRYWLIKSEPSEFSLEDLKSQQVEPWTGVRNYQARNTMRDLMQVGDQCLFYHSSITPPGVVGIATVGSKPYADPTQFDEKGEYFEARATPEKPVWILVDIHYASSFPRMVTLDKLRTNPATSSMVVTKRGMRLSVQPVTKEEFAAVLLLANSPA